MFPSWCHKLLKSQQGHAKARRHAGAAFVRPRFGYRPVLEEFEDRIVPAQDHLAVLAPVTVTAGIAFPVTVTALNASNATDTAYAGTVSFSSTDPAAGLPANTTLVGGTGTFSVTLKTAASQTVTATDTATSTIMGMSRAITVNPSSATTFALTILPNVINAGVGVFFFCTVTVLDQFSNVVSSYTGTVHFTSTDAAATLPPDQTLSNGVGMFKVIYNTIGMQTVTATDTVTSSITGTSIPLPVSIAPTHTILTTPTNAIPGIAFTVTVTALDANNNPALAYSGPCPINFSGGQSVLPPNVTLSNGFGTFTAILDAAGTETLGVSLTLAGNTFGGVNKLITVSALSATHFGFTVPTFATSGIPFNVTVKALDAYGNTAASYNGTVTFSSSDAAAAMPAAGTLTNGVGIFGVTLNKDGNQTLTAADTLTSSFTTTSSPITVSGVATHLVISAPNTATAAAPFSITITALDASNNLAMGYNGTVKVTSSDPLAVVRATPTLTNGMYTYPNITLGTGGNQTLTAQDTTTSSIAGVSNPILVSPALATGFVLSGVPSNILAGTPFVFTITARDQFNNIATGYSGPISFTSTDPQASLPTSGTLTKGVGTFTATFATSGNQSITATGLGQTITFSKQGFLVNDAPQAVTVGDLNGDGNLDIIGGSLLAGYVSVLLGNGNGTFGSLINTPVGGGAIDGVAEGDFNGDGIIDLAVANDDPPILNVLMGNGNGTFAAAETYSIGGVNIAAFAIAVGDFTGDGVLDLAVACGEDVPPYADYVAILLGIGDGTFEPAKDYAFESNVSGQTYPRSIAVGDLNNDGKLDLAVTNNDAIDVLLGNGNGSFRFAGSYPIGNGDISGSVGTFAGQLALADLTGDGDLDMVATNYDSGTVSVLLNNGDGTFGPAANYYAFGPTSVAVADFNGDGIPDLAVDVPDNSMMEMWFGEGNGTFANPESFIVPFSEPAELAVGDFNGDGRPDVVVANHNFTILLNQPVTISNSFTASVSSAAVNHFAVTGVPTNVTAGTAFNLTIIAQNQFYNTVIGYTGTVHFASSDKNASLPADATLTNGTGVFSATLNTAGNQTITAYDASNNSITGRSGQIAVSTGTTHFLVSAPSSTAAGAVFVFTVTALDQFNNLAGAYAGTVRLSSSDGQATLAANATLNGGIGFFAAVLRTAGNQTLTATDTVSSGIAGSSAPIAVNSLAANHLVVAAPANAITGIAFSVTVTAEDPFGNIAAAYGGTVQFTSSDAGASPPPNSTLTAGQGVFTFTLKTPGTQTIAATDISATTISGTSNNIAALGLVVTSLTPTSTGFVATFNKPFDPSTINLYDAAGALGPDDVLLTGPGSLQTSIHGSLIIDPTDTTITFVKTSTFTNPINSFNPQTGVLAAGTYTVTFRSAANGFKDLLGAPLDGTASGNPAGSNYTTTFVVSSTPAEVVGIPGFARGPGNTVNLPNNQAQGVPISLSTGANVTSGKFTLQYNSALLSITGVTVNSGLTGATLALDASSTPGNAVIDFSTTTALASGPIRLGGLVASVPNTAAALYKSKALLHFSSVQLNGGAIAVTPDDAVDVDAYFGDTNGDGQLSGGDAALISSVASNVGSNAATGVIGGFSAYPLADPVLLGDLSGSGSVNAAAVTLLNSYLSGTPRTQIPPVPTGLTIVTTGPDPSLSVGSADLSPHYATPGSTVVVPVNIDTARPDASTGMTEAIVAVHFDPAVFTVSAQDVDLGTLPLTPTPLPACGERGGGEGNGWQLDVAINNQTGEIGIDLFNSNPIQTTNGGSLVTIALHVRDNAPAGESSLDLVNSVNPTGQRAYFTTVSDAQGAFILHPALTALGSEPGTPPGDVTVGSGQLTVDSGQWPVGSGQWPLGSEEEQIARPDATSSSLPTAHYPLPTVFALDAAILELTHFGEETAPPDLAIADSCSTAPASRSAIPNLQSPLSPAFVLDDQSTTASAAAAIDLVFGGLDLDWLAVLA